MHRRSGPRVTLNYYAQVELLPDDELFSAVEIASLKFDRESQASEWKRMANALRKFASRNQMSDSPDNCCRDEQGQPILKNGKALLLPGERSRRWRGQAWKSNLFDEDRIAIREYLNTLSPVGDERATVENDGPVSESRSLRKPKWVQPVVWAFAATAVVFGLWLFKPGSAHQSLLSKQKPAQGVDALDKNSSQMDPSPLPRKTATSFAVFARQRRARMLVACKIPQLKPDELVWKEGPFPEGKPFPAVYLVSLAPEPGS